MCTQSEKQIEADFQSRKKRLEKEAIEKAFLGEPGRKSEAEIAKEEVKNTHPHPNPNPNL
jgi:hypothetical protein